MTAVKTTELGFPAVLVEQPGGELAPYWIDAPVLEAGERKAFVLTKPDGDTRRVALTVHRGWVCDCRDALYCLRKKRTRTAGAPCKHVTAVLAMLAEESRDRPT